MVALANIRVGDFILLDGGARGEVVFNSVSGEYSDRYPKADWHHLDEAGLMVMTIDTGLTFYPQSKVTAEGIEVLASPARSLETLARVRVGDWVLVARDVEGEVVFNAYANDYSVAFPQADWARDDGLMIMQQNGGLIYFPLDAFADDGDPIEVLRPARAIS